VADNHDEIVSIGDVAPVPIGHGKHDSAKLLKEEALFLEHEKKSLEVEQQRQIVTSRPQLSKWTLRLGIGWICVSVALVVLDGLHWLDIADSVLIALLTNTTATVLGLAYIVLKHFFPEERRP